MITKHQSRRGVAKKVCSVDRTGGNAYLRLSGRKMLFLGGLRAWTPDLCYVIIFIPFSPACPPSLNNGQSQRTMDPRGKSEVVNHP